MGLGGHGRALESYDVVRVYELNPPARRTPFAPVVPRGCEPKSTPSPGRPTATQEILSNRGKWKRAESNRRPDRIVALAGDGLYWVRTSDPHRVKVVLYR